MAVTIHAKQTEVKTEEGIEEVLHCAAVDALGDLEAEIATAQDKLSKSAHYKELSRLTTLHAEAITSVCDELGYVKNAVAEDETTVTGLRFRAVLSKSANSTTVTDKAGLIKWIEKSFSKAELMELMKFGVTELRSYLPKTAFETFTETKRTGNRKLVLKAFKPLS